MAKKTEQRQPLEYWQLWARLMWLLIVKLGQGLALDGSATCSNGSCHNPAYPGQYCGVHDSESGGLVGRVAVVVDLWEFYGY